MLDLNFPEELDSEIFFSVKKNRLFVFIFLLGTMMIFFLCDLRRVYVDDTCYTYSLLQIPIIIGACAGGPLVGVILGTIAALMELMCASFDNLHIDVIFSPFAFFEADGYHFGGNISSIFICFLSKLAIALIAGWIFKAFKNRGQTIWKMILVAISAIVSILFACVVVFFLFNLFFVKFLPNVAYSGEFQNFVNSALWLSCVQKLIANICIDPLIVYAMRMIAKLD